MLKEWSKVLLDRFISIGFLLMPVQRNKVLVSSYYGRGYGDNPKYIIDALLHKDQNLRILWLTKNEAEGKDLPDGVEAVRTNSIAALYHMATAKIWIDNCRRHYAFKKKNQFYIQTWHGFALKRIEEDVKENLGRLYVYIAKRDSDAIDVIISEAAFMTNIYRNSFWYDGEILQWGSPRNDILLDEEKRHACRDRVLNFYNIAPTTKILLYAPTFRADESLEPYSVDYTAVKKACEQRFGEEFTVLVRLHPNIARRCTELNLQEQGVVSATDYPDMQELLAASDVVISDYSSLMFDFALSQKPCFQFATDIEEYKQDRNFYFQLDHLPFSVAQNNQELVDNILCFDEEKYNEKISEFFDSVGMVRTGDSSEKCADLILKYTETKNH